MSDPCMYEWEDICLRDLVKGFRGVSYRPENLLDHSSPSSATLLRATNIQNGNLTFDDVQFVPESLVAPSQILEEADIAVCMSNGSKSLVGKSAVFRRCDGNAYTVGAFCSIFRPFDVLQAEFVSHLFRSEKYQRRIDFELSGSAINNLKNSSVESIVFRLPVDERKRRKIATILTSVDTAIEKTEALIAKFQQIKAGLMHDLFTRGVLPSGQLRPPREQAPELYQETAIGWIPREWQHELLDNLAYRGSGHTPNKDHPEYWNGGIKWVSLADSNKLDQLYVSDTELEISHLGILNSSAVLHPAGIVVLSRDAGVGKSAITTEPMAVSQHFMCWKCDQRMDNHFLYYWLQFNKRTFENIAMGSTILTIGLPYFKRLKIVCPVDLAEQKAIAGKLKAADARLFAMKHDLEKLKKQKLGLMQDLLTGKVAVKLDATAP